MKVVKIGILVALAMLAMTSIVASQAPPGVPPVTSIDLSTDRVVISTTGIAQLTAQIQSDQLNDRLITFEIVSNAQRADLGTTPDEPEGDSVSDRTNASGVATAYLFAVSEGNVTVQACWYGETTVCSNTITILIVSTPYGVSLSTADPVKDALTGQSVQFSIQVLNTGLYADNFSITVNAPGVVTQLDKQYIELNSGQEGTVLLTAYSNQPGNYTITVTATSVDHPEATDTLTLYLNVREPIHNVILTPDQQIIEVDPNENAIFSITITNAGEVTETFALSLTHDPNVTASLSTNSVTLNPNESQVVQLTAHAFLPATYPITVTATSANTENSTTVYLTVRTVYSFTLSVLPKDITVLVNDTATFTITITNTGNVPDSYTIASDAGQLSTSIISLGVGESETIYLNFSSSTSGQYIITINVTSVGSGSSVSDTVNVTVISSPGTLPGAENPPTDTDNDGLYEDVDGDGMLTFEDVKLFFTDWMMDLIPSQYTQFFDFDGDNLLSFDDVKELFFEWLLS